MTRLNDLLVGVAVGLCVAVPVAWLAIVVWITR